MKLKWSYFWGVIMTISFLISCTKEYSYENGATVVFGGSSSGTATYMLNNTSGNCSPAIIGGAYNMGATMNDSDIVIIDVTVDTVGTYDVSTGSGNGIYFTGFGTFTATGLQTVSLKALGTPESIGSYEFIPGSNGCPFIINFN